MLELRDYQTEAIQAVRDAWAADMYRPLVAHPTGTGKTVTFSHLIYQHIIEHPHADGRALVLVHRDELAHQTVDKLSQVAPELPVGIVKAELDDYRAPIVVASVQTLARRARLRRVLDWAQDHDAHFDLVIVDEAHHAVAPTWRKTIDAFAPREERVPVVGFTATPERGDEVGLAAVFDKIVHQFSILEAIVAGHLVDLRGVQIGTDVDLSSVRTRGGDYADADLGRVLGTDEAVAMITKGWARYATDRKTLAFTPTVDMAGRLAQAVRAAGGYAAMVSGATPMDLRRQVLGDLRAGRINFLANCAVLTEGFDEPSVDCVLLARPTQSRPLYVQMVGRGTRKYPGKADCLVIDVTGVAARHGLVTVSELAGLPAIKLKGHTVTEAADKLARPDYQMAMARRTQALSLFKGKMRWLPIEDGYVLPINAEVGTMVILPEGDALDPSGTWSVHRLDNRSTVMADVAVGLSIDYAQGYAEDVAQRSPRSLARNDARWLKMEPTPAQLARLRTYGLRDTSKVTSRGQAADLLTRVHARLAIRRHRKAGS